MIYKLKIEEKISEKIPAIFYSPSKRTYFQKLKWLDSQVLAPTLLETSKMRFAKKKHFYNL